MQQKMGYLRACQDWFVHIDESERPANRLVLNAVPTQSRNDTPPVVDNWFRAECGLVSVGTGYIAQCGACDELLPAEEAVPCSVCPFSRMFMLRCRACLSD